MNLQAILNLKYLICVITLEEFRVLLEKANQGVWLLFAPLKGSTRRLSIKPASPQA